MYGRGSLGVFGNSQRYESDSEGDGCPIEEQFIGPFVNHQPVDAPVPKANRDDTRENGDELRQSMHFHAPSDVGVA